MFICKVHACDKQKLVGVVHVL